jgi:ribosome maturation protein SDO1
MSRQINQPINQVRLTNVAVVRMNKGGKRFEIACYRNKVVDFRKGLEADLDEVLQTDRIFTNVSKGQFAKHSDLEKVFGTKNEEAIARIILEKGQLQVSDLERQSQLENTLAQIATWVASHCVHPESQRPYTISQIKHALGKQYQVQPHKPIKKQYLDCVKFLKKMIPIERAKMELAISYQSGADREEMVQNELHAKNVTVTKREQCTGSEESSNSKHSPQEITKCVVVADPSLYRPLDDLVRGLVPTGKLEILRQVVTQEGDVDLEMEIERKKQNKSSQDKDVDVEDEDDEDEDNDSNHNRDDSSQNDKDNLLAEQLQQKVSIPSSKQIESDDDDDNDDDMSGDDNTEEGSEENTMPMTRKQQKQKKKQGKKAKRRQKEEQAEREERSAAEQKRQEERRARVDEKIQPVVQANAAAAAEGDTRPCNTCGGNFPTAAAYRAHFKSDWHRFNQKLKLQGMPPVSEEEFKLCDEETFFS